MKFQPILMALTCAIALTGCSNTQAQPTAKSPDLQISTSETTSSSVATTTPAESQTAGAEISKSSTEQTSRYQCKGTNNHLFLGNGTMKNKYGNPIYILHLCVGGKERRSFEIVTGRNYTQQRNRNQSGTQSPLPNGHYRMSNTLVQGTLVEVGKVDGLNVRQPFLAISPLFSTGRSALGFHVDPSYNKDPKEDGTSGCIGFLNQADFKSFWANVQEYKIKDLQVAINTKAVDNPNVADR
jgi:L,D-transpeptidase catalytic domain